MKSRTMTLYQLAKTLLLLLAILLGYSLGEMWVNTHRPEPIHITATGPILLDEDTISRIIEGMKGDGK